MPHHIYLLWLSKSNNNNWITSLPPYFFSDLKLFSWPRYLIIVLTSGSKTPHSLFFYIKSGLHLWLCALYWYLTAKTNSQPTAFCPPAGKWVNTLQRVHTILRGICLAWCFIRLWIRNSYLNCKFRYFNWQAQVWLSLTFGKLTLYVWHIKCAN